MLKIAVTGPESSGKSTLTLALALALGCPWVPEYARTYLTDLGTSDYSLEDFKKMAFGQEQSRRWYEHENQADFLVLDTDFLVYSIWSKMRYGSELPFIQALFARNPVDLYLLCRPDIPWEPDPLREHPTERDTLFQMYLEQLEKGVVPYLVLHGSLEHRLAQCLEHLGK